MDSYFASIGAKDVDDCGKKLVCEIETIVATKRTVEEMLVLILFFKDKYQDLVKSKHGMKYKGAPTYDVRIGGGGSWKSGRSKGGQVNFIV